MKRKPVSFFIVAVALWAVGCGSKGTITGTVTYKGTPIPAGYIVFAPENGAPPANAPIRDGQYTAEQVPIGPAKVTVASLSMGASSNPMQSKMGRMGGGDGPHPEMMKKMAEGPPPDAPIPPEARAAMSSSGASLSKKGLVIPDRYADPDKSGLTYTVQSGKQTKDFQLE